MASNKIRMLKPNGKFVSVAAHNVSKYKEQGWKTQEMLDISEVGDFLVSSVEARGEPKNIEATNINPLNGKVYNSRSVTSGKCIFPFRKKAGTRDTNYYTHCIPDSDKRQWCATKINNDDDRRWTKYGFCLNEENDALSGQKMEVVAAAVAASEKKGSPKARKSRARPKVIVYIRNPQGKIIKKKITDLQFAKMQQTLGDFNNGVIGAVLSDEYEPLKIEEANSKYLEQGSKKFQTTNRNPKTGRIVSQASVGQCIFPFRRKNSDHTYYTSCIGEPSWCATTINNPIDRRQTSYGYCDSETQDISDNDSDSDDYDYFNDSDDFIEEDLSNPVYYSSDDDTSLYNSIVMDRAKLTVNRRRPVSKSFFKAATAAEEKKLDELEELEELDELDIGYEDDDEDNEDEEDEDEDEDYFFYPEVPPSPNPYDSD